METATITARIRSKKSKEFHQVMESLQLVIKDYCKQFEMDINHKNNLTIKIVIKEKKELKNNFYNNEFNLLKGTIKSLCANVVIKINDLAVN